MGKKIKKYRQIYPKPIDYSLANKYHNIIFRTENKTDYTSNDIWLVNEISKKLNANYHQVNSIVRAFVLVATNALRMREKFIIDDFGSFMVKKFKYNKKEINIIKFKAGKKFKEELKFFINKKYAHQTRKKIASPAIDKQIRDYKQSSEYNRGRTSSDNKKVC